MNKGQRETMTIRVASTAFVTLALAVFKPFGLDAWHWQAYVHLAIIFLLGVAACMLTDVVLKYVVRMPRSYDHGVSYIIRRNLWFQLINTPLVALVICLYRHFVLSDRVPGNQLSWGNYFETLLIIAFCSFAIGLYWRFKYRSRYLAMELEETRQLNEQLRSLTPDLSPNESGVYTSSAENASDESNHSPFLGRGAGDEVTLRGTTNETVTLHIAHLLYIEAVGNYVKVCHLCGGEVRTDMLRATMKQTEDSLQAYPMVVRCHRAFLVNLVQVEQFVTRSGSMLLLIKHTGDTIPVSRSNMAHVKEALSNG
jgi:DNA-binding LytR/AlgR family response regulator